MQGFRYFCRQKLMTSMGRKFAAVLCSTLLLSPGWLGGTGFTLLFGLVPLLWISDSYDASRRSWWKVFGWALLTFVLWNVSTIWWIWLATPVGPFAATIASSFLNMVAFMLFHTVSKRDRRHWPTRCSFQAGSPRSTGTRPATSPGPGCCWATDSRTKCGPCNGTNTRASSAVRSGCFSRISCFTRPGAVGATQSLDLGRSGRTPSDSRFAGHFLELRST